MPPASLADRLSRISPLSNAERSAILALEARNLHVRRGATLLAEGARANDVFILSSGVMAGRIDATDGWRRMLRLYLPGDLMSLGAMVLRESAEAMIALSDCVVHPVARAALGTMLAEHPRLALLLMVDEQVERHLLTDRLIAIETATPKARMAGLLIDLRNRLQAVDKGISTAFTLPLTNEEIGEAVALKQAEAIRALQQLETDRLIARDAARITFLDERALARVAGLKDGRAGLELGWLPRSGEMRRQI
jgi:CRP-like cAMP-binding protein